MSDLSKLRMNLAAIKKVDPYANEIVDTSSHVAFYTFNATTNEWEKTDVEGVLFIYIRNAQPLHSLFINNRLNTTSFVEPITNQLELQSQPPFLLYRNERSRIRGFWFYNCQECGRIANLVSALIKDIGCREGTIPAVDSSTEREKDPGAKPVNIFKMLSKAQEDYNTSLNGPQSQQQATTPPRNVLNFFAAAKPAASEVPQMKKLLPNTLSVEQIEKQQCVQSGDNIQMPSQAQLLFTPTKQWKNFSMPVSNEADHFSTPIRTSGTDLVGRQFKTPSTPGILSTNADEDYLRKLLIGEDSGSLQLNTTRAQEEAVPKPALIPPTMYEKLSGDASGSSTFNKATALTQPQFVQAFTHLIQNDEDFVHNLHEAYLKVLSKTIVS